MSETKRGFVIKEDVPTDQRLKYRVTPMPGRLMTLKAIGGQMEAMGKLLASMAKAGGHPDWVALLLRAETYTDGSLEFEVMIAPKKTPPLEQPDLPSPPPEASTNEGK